MAEGAELGRVEVDPSNVRFVLRRCVTDEADCVSEVVYGYTGHDGVEVDDNKRTAGNAVKKDIVALRVVVSNADWEVAGGV